MLLLSIPLDDLRIQKPAEYFNDMADDLNVSASLRKRSSSRLEKDVISEEEENSNSDGSSGSEKKVKSVKKLVRIMSSDSEDAADRSHSKKTVKKPQVRNLRSSSRQCKVTKNMKEESSDSDEDDESPSSEEDDEDRDPNFDNEKEMEKLQRRKEKEAYVKPETVKKSAYEEMIEKNRLEKLAFLQSLKMDEVKAGFSEIAEKKKPQTFKRKYPSIQKPKTPPVLRKSRRLANTNTDLSEDSLYYNALKRNEDTVEVKPKKVIPAEISFKEALESEDFYESYKVDVNFKESEHETKFTVYDKSVLGKMTVSESNIAKVTPSRITALTWYPSPEQMIIAAGDKYGNLGIWNVESGDPYVFKTHTEGITNLRFNPFNQAQLISSSYEGILRCGDIMQHNFSEIYNVSDEASCTYFDVLSASTYLVAQRNGQVALVDKRTKGSCEKKHECHDYSIKTVNIHPIDRNFFVTAENKGSIRLWDLRKLQSTPVADIIHHKRCVHSAFFSPVTGNSILALSADDSISIFDSKILSSDIKVRVQMKHNNCTGRWLSVFRATWLPNSDETFMVGSMQHPRRIEVYDKNMFVYSLMMHENLSTITSTNAFHPTRPALAGGNSSGKVVVFV